MNKLSIIKIIDLVTLSIIVLGALYLGYSGVTSSKNKPIMILRVGKRNDFSRFSRIY